MEYDYIKLLGKLATNAAMWVAIIAMILLPITEQDASFLIIFVFIVLVNFVLVLMIKNWAPEFFARMPFADLYQSGPTAGKNAPASQNIGFRLSPLSYPKVHDEELRAFVPEYVKVDVIGNNGIVFSGNVPRGVLKQLRQGITDSLEARLPSANTPTALNANSLVKAPSQAMVLEKGKAKKKSRTKK